MRATTRLGRLGARQLRQDRAGQMAAALAFRTLFGLVPLAVVGGLLASGIGNQSFEELVGELLTRLGLDAWSVSAIEVGGDAAAGAGDGAGGEAAAEAGAAAPEAITLADWLLDIVAQAEQIGAGTLTWVGLAVLAYSAMGLMTTIESSFNTILRAGSSRPWRVRLPVYWFVLCMLPAVVALVVWVDTRFDAFITSTEGPAWLLRTLSFLWGITALWVTLLLLYRLVPNTRVSLRAIMTGAATAAILLETVRRGFGLYIEHAVTLRQLAGTLGLLPLFMLYVYVTWLAILFGLEVAAVTDRLRSGETLDGGPPIVDPAAALALMGVVAGRFERGQTAELGTIAVEAGLPGSVAERLAEALVDAGLLRRVGDADEGALVPARPPNRIPATEVLAVGQRLASCGGGGLAGLMDALRDAQTARLAERSLAQLAEDDAGTTRGPAPA